MKRGMATVFRGGVKPFRDPGQGSRSLDQHGKGKSISIAPREWMWEGNPKKKGKKTGDRKKLPRKGNSSGKLQASENTGIG